jgi:hypothetical protein
MKNFTFLILIQFLVFTALKGQQVDVPQTQNPLIVKITASWCPFCGSWGWSFFDDIYSDNKEKAIFLSVHHSGDHTNAAATEMTENFSVFGQPRFLIDGVDQNVSSTNASAKRMEFENRVEEETAGTPLIQTGIDASYSGDQIRVDYSVRSFSSLDGEYFLAFYLVEKVFVGYQAIVGPDAQHRELLRKELTGNTFGSVLFSGTVPSGQVWEGSFQADLENYDPENLSIVGIIWEKAGGDYFVVNTNADTEVEFNNTSSLKAAKQPETTLMVYPSVVEDAFDVAFYLGVQPEAVRLLLLDDMGRILGTLPTGSVDAGENLIRIDRLPAWYPGVYYLVLETPGSVLSKKLIFH